MRLRRKAGSRQDRSGKARGVRGYEPVPTDRLERLQPQAAARGGRLRGFPRPAEAGGRTRRSPRQLFARLRPESAAWASSSLCRLDGAIRDHRRAGHIAGSPSGTDEATRRPLRECGRRGHYRAREGTCCCARFLDWMPPGRRPEGVAAHFAARPGAKAFVQPTMSPKPMKPMQSPKTGASSQRAWCTLLSIVTS